MILEPLDYTKEIDLEDYRYKRKKELDSDNAKVYAINHKAMNGTVDNTNYNHELEDLFIR